MAELPESIIFMDTRKKPAIIWCDGNVNIENINSRNYMGSIQTWKSYTDYLKDIIDEEFYDLD